MEVYAVNANQMNDWKAICHAFAKKRGAKLVFVNETSMGLEYPDGVLEHIYIDELEDYLKREQGK